MATATITLKDDGESIKITLDFGKNGADDNSYAHHAAINVVKVLHDQSKRVAAENKEAEG